MTYLAAWGMMVPMRHAPLVPVGLLLLLAPAPAQRTKKVKPVKCVRLATTWETAVLEARMLRRPIVVHNHGFDAASWAVHSSLLQSRKYVKLAKDRTVEVMVLQDIDERTGGDDKGRDPKLAEYDAKDATGKRTRYLANFPGLTLAELVAFGRSGATEYDHAGTTPFTTVVDPFTLGGVQSIAGPVDYEGLAPIIAGAWTAIRKQQGAPKITRKELDKLVAVESRALADLGRGRWRRALDAARGLAKKARRWPRSAAGRIRTLVAKAREGGAKELAAIEKLAKQSARRARRRLREAWKRFAGTELAARAKALAASLATRLEKGK